MFFGHLYVFLGELFVKIFCPFFDGVVCFFGISNINLEINPLSVASSANIFFHSVGCLFVLFRVSFAGRNF